MFRVISRWRLFGGLSPGARPPGGRPLGGGNPSGRRSRRAGRRRRHSLAALLSAIAAVGLCVVAACALFVPGFVLGAGPAAMAPAPQTEPGGAAPSTGVAAPSGPGPAAPAAPATPSAGPAAPSADLPVPSAGSLLVTLPWGGGDGQVGLEAPGEGLARGPEAVAVAPDGRIAILDSVNKRVVLLDPTGAFMAAAPIALAEPRFLAVDGARLYVLDCDSDRQIVSLDWSGASLGAAALPELTDVVTGLFATDGGPCVEVAHDGVFAVDMTGAAAGLQAAAADGAMGGVPGGALIAPAADVRAATGGAAKPMRAALRALAGRPLGTDLGRVAKITFKPGKGPDVKFSKVDKKSLKASQTTQVSLTVAPGRAIEHLVSVDGDKTGGLIVGARLLGAGSQALGQPSLLLTQYAPSETMPGSVSAGAATTPNGGAAATILLTESSFAYLGQPYVVAPDGRVYQPVADEAGYSIVVHSFASATAADPVEVGR